MEGDALSLYGEGRSQGGTERKRKRGRNPAAPASKLSQAVKMPGTWSEGIFRTFHLGH